MKKNFYFITICIFLFGNCQKDKSQLYPNEVGVFVDEFFFQANLRNENIHIEDYNFEIKFGDIEDPFVAGTCNERINEIILDSVLWHKNDESENEWLIFHELGHCLLDRTHRNNKTPNCECSSYMKGVENDFECSINLYSKKWKAYYLDELFNETVLLPNWYLTNQAYHTSFIPNNLSVTIKDTLVDRINIDSIPFKNIDNFLLEVNFGNWNTEENLVQIVLGNITFANCNTCTGSKINLYAENLAIQYYESNELSFTSDIKLTMIRNVDIISFYVNETFVHAMEYDLIEGNTLKSNGFDDLIEVDVNILLE